MHEKWLNSLDLLDKTLFCPGAPLRLTVFLLESDEASLKAIKGTSGYQACPWQGEGGR